MTANADLTTSAKENILLVPNEAITSDRQAGRYYVNRVVTNPDGSVSTEPVKVTIGLKDSNYTEITSGIQEGNQLSTITISAGVEQSANGFTPRPEGGNNGVLRRVRT